MAHPSTRPSVCGKTIPVMAGQTPSPSISWEQMMLPVVDPTEIVPVEFDFSELLKDYPSATITGQRIGISVVSGVDDDPASRLYGTPTVAGLVVTQWFKPLWAEVKYRIRCNVDVSGTNYKPTIAIELTVANRVDA
jgi:hypothetical protein